MQPQITLYLLKVTEFCNLNCPYCYMFNLRDFSYKTKPKVMPLETVRVMAAKAAELARKQNVSQVSISLHGGEPLLAGRDWFRSALEIFRQAGGDSVEFAFVTQTNGVLIDREWLDFFESSGIQVGISMDGPREIHDKFRVNFAGRGSYDDVVRGVSLALQYPKVFGGVLCVIDPQANGLEVYRHFRDLGVRTIDFLWPLEPNWDAPPAGHEVAGATPYADYLISVFDEWWHQDDKSIRVRYLSQLIRNIFGARGGIDSLGGNPVSITSIDSDGSIEPVDSLKACGDGFTDMGLNILRDPIDAVYDQPLFQAAIAGQEGLCAQCRECPLHDVCGGGYLPNRYSHKNGFANPTVFCRDIWKLTSHLLDSVVDIEEVRMFLRAQRGMPLASAQPN